jgi:hypothetical protein
MSHLSSVELTITNLDILTKACENLGLTLNRSKKTYKSYWTPEIDCDAVIQDQEGGEAAIISKKDNTGYDLQWDSYQNSLLSKIGENCGHLNHAYGVEAVIQQANSVGIINSVEPQLDGSTIVQGVFI